MAAVLKEEDFVEARIARLESDVANIRSDVSELKTDMRELKKGAGRGEGGRVGSESRGQ